MSSLKQALLKAGLKETPKPKDVKEENKREHVTKSQRTEAVSHQEQRNFCEECKQVRPDVELYYHRNPTTEAEWICVRCADQLKLPDSTRQTAQSDTSIKGMFRREHGATRPKTEFKTVQKPRPKGDVDGNR